MKDGIVIAGNMVMDVIKIIETYPAESSLTTIGEISHAPGGAVCNCAADLAQMDRTLPVTAVGAIGQDDFGDSITAQLAAHENINTDYLIHKGRTSFTDVMTRRDTGSRTFFVYKGADSSLSVEDIPFDKLEGGLFHIGYIMLLDKLDAQDDEYGTAMARLLCRARKKGFRTSIDVVTESGSRYKTLVPPSLKYTDYCCINETEAQMITDVPLENLTGTERKENFQKACRALKSMGVSRWAVVHSPRYCAGLDEEGTFHEIECDPLPKGFIKGSVGAGDAFVSGILYAAHRGIGLSTALCLGEAAAISSLSCKGATKGVGTLEEILSLYAELTDRTINL